MDVVPHYQGGQLVTDGEDSEVVALRSFAGELFYALLHHLHDLFGTHAAGTGKLVQHPLFAVLRVGVVLRLGQSVGVEEQGLSVGHVRDLRLIGKAAHDADRQVGQYVDHLLRVIGVYQHRRVVPGVAIPQGAVLQLEHADKEGDEHVLVVRFGDGVVHLTGYPGGVFGVGGDASEE